MTHRKAEPLLRMNSALGKRILALARKGDYAHAGEEEAIHLTLDAVPKCADQTLLDIGCGRGGTARYVQDHGWGRVTGFDIEGESIQRAQSLHPDITFLVSDVLDASENVPGPFDVLYSFNAFYAFPDQRAALVSLRALAREGAPLVLFDYVDRGGFYASEFAQSEEATHWKPFQLDTFPKLLAETGWTLQSVRSLHNEYDRWYVALVKRIESMRSEIISVSNEEAFAHAFNVYRQLLQAVQDGRLGGAVVLARATP